MKYTLPIFPRNNCKVLDRVMFLSLGFFPIFSLSIKGWVSTLSIFTSIVAIFYLIRIKMIGNPIFQEDAHQRKWMIVLLISFSFPILSIFLSQFIRYEWNASDYDAPARLLLSGIVILMIFQLKQIPFITLRVSIPLMQLTSLITLIYWPNTDTWSVERPTIAHVDPLMLCALSLMGSLLCMININLDKHSKLWLNFLNLVGVVSGFYIALATQSRTGWLAVPIVIILLIIYRSRLPKRKKFPFAIITALLISLGAFYFSETLHNRVERAVEDVTSYNLSGSDENTSLGLRITFFHIAIELFKQRPLSGWGSGYQAGIETPQIQAFSSAVTRQFAVDALFHSELGTTMVKSGVWGVIATLFIFIVPMIFLIRLNRMMHSRFNQRDVVDLQLMGLTVLTTFIITGLSTEVFNLKYVASFFSLLMSSILGSALVLLDHDSLELGHDS